MCTPTMAVMCTENHKDKQEKKTMIEEIKKAYNDATIWVLVQQQQQQQQQQQRQ